MFRILEGDVVEQLRTLAEASVDAIVTDPPYGLEFMGKEWDAPWKSQPLAASSQLSAEGPKVKKSDHRQVFDGTLKMSKNNPYLRSRVRSGNGAGYGADEHVMQALQAWHYSWAREALRVLKPGGHLLAFGGSRTYHRLACAIEDAGFEIRDQIMWIYGSGFPKSLDVSKAIDKAGGKANNWFGPWLRKERERIGMTATRLAELGGFYDNVNHGGLVVNWELGYGLPSAKDFNKVCDILGLPFERLEEVEREVLGQRKVHKGLAFTSEGEEYLDVTAPATDAAKQWQGWGTALKPAHEPIVVARKPLIGTVAANVLEYGAGALNIDGCRIGTEARTYTGSGPHLQKLANHGKGDTGIGMMDGSGKDLEFTVQGRWPANVIHDGSEEVVSLFPDSTSGDNCVKRATGVENGGQTGPAYGAESRPAGTPMITYGDSGSAARFFYKVRPEGNATNFQMQQGMKHSDSGSQARFFYCAKADKEEREQGLQGLQQDPGRKPGNPGGDNPRNRGVHEQLNHHPTVKPVDLMAYLCRLATPPEGTVLDCFMGSGSTGIAALREGFDFIGIEINAQYCEIARRRIEGDSPLFNRNRAAIEKRQGPGNRD